MPDLGIRMQLWIGRDRPAPAPYEVVEALREVEVTNNDSQRDGFSLTFTLGRRGAQQDFPLLRDGLLDPPARVTIILVIQGLPSVLINGMITRHQIVPSNQAGQSVLKVLGDDTSLQMDQVQKKATFRNLSDQGIVKKIMEDYKDKGLLIDAAATKETPQADQRITSQQDTDLAFITKLAQRNSFRFYTEPASLIGVSTAYFGPRDRSGLPCQRELTFNMGPFDTVTQLSFGFDALAPVAVQASTLDPSKGQANPVTQPATPDRPLSSHPAGPLRTVQLDNTAGLNDTQAGLHAQQTAEGSADASTATGTLDTVRYGGILRAHHIVEVRGAGKNQNGEYYVTQVTHQIRRGECKQAFKLSREGVGAAAPRVKGCA